MDDGAAAYPGEHGPEAPTERYILGGLIGRGGMGVVRAATDTAIGREVAFKELDPAIAGNARAAARLAREAAITGRLDHPGIVAVHDAGRMPDGRPFYTMRLVRGRSLARAFAEAGNAETRRRLLRHLLAAAEAVAAAHTAGIVHRDLKPANILIGAHGETQVVDWGLASPTPDAEAAWGSLPAPDAPGAVVGTPAYMAPGQARGEPPDPRHDVWSLGATLYELLAGAPPVSGSPEGILAAARAGTHAPLAAVAPNTPPELAAIVTRALAFAPADRYPDAAALADDLLAYFEGRRVAAHAYSPRELLERLAAAWRVPLVVGGLGIVAVAVAVGVGWWRTAHALDRAVRAEVSASAARGTAERQLARTWIEEAVVAVGADDRARAETLAVRALAYGEDPDARGVLAAFGRAPRPRLVDDREGPTCTWSALAPDGAWLLCGTPDRLSRWEGGGTRWEVPSTAVGGDIQEDGAVITWDAVGTSTVHDEDRGTALRTTPLPTGEWSGMAPPVWVGGAPWPAGRVPASGCAGQLRRILPDRDGATIAAVCTDGRLYVGPPDRPNALTVQTAMRGDQGPAGLAWTPGGDLLAGTLRGGLRLLDRHTGRVLRSEDTTLGSLDTLRVSPDGAIAAVAGTSGGIGLWNLHTGGWLGELPERLPGTFGFLPDGRLLVHNDRLHTWEVPSPTPYRVRVDAGLADVAISADGAALALASGDGAVTVFRLADGSALTQADTGSAVVKAVAFSPDGARVAAAGMNAPANVLLDRDGALTPLAGDRRIRRLAWIGDGLLGAEMFGGLARWTAAGFERFAAGPTYIDVEPAPGGGGVVLLDTDGTLSRLAPGADTPERLAQLRGGRAVAAGGERIAAVTPTAVVLLGPDGAVQQRIERADAFLLDVALSPDGARVAASSREGRAYVWNAETGALLAALAGHAERVPALEFTPDGRALVTGSWDHSARIWDLTALDRPVDALAAEVRRAWGTGIE